MPVVTIHYDAFCPTQMHYNQGNKRQLFLLVLFNTPVVWCGTILLFGGWSVLHSDSPHLGANAEHWHAGTGVAVCNLGEQMALPDKCRLSPLPRSFLLQIEALKRIDGANNNLI